MKLVYRCGNNNYRNAVGVNRIIVLVMTESCDTRKGAVICVDVVA